MWRLLLALAAATARELDPAACSTRFDVQRDKIIRTEESRDMGARYLSELDVGTRHECLRLCCETDACDVFVYEEKSPGSCYLFNCGPPEDFRCKFTAHGNFSSGVLAMSRRLAELQDQERLVEHEQQLATLRSATSSSSTTTTTTTTRPPPPTTRSSAQTTLPQPSRCSRYQFACHSGAECIAVYNACDGVAQCADGSDEAPELGCPTIPPVRFRSTTTRPKPPEHPLDNADTRSNSISSENQKFVLPENTVLTGDHWPHRLTQAQPQYRYNEGAPSSHIFSHKGGLLQEPETIVSGSQYGPYEPWPRQPWPHSQSGVEWGGGVSGPNSGPGAGGSTYSRAWLDWNVPRQPPPPPEMPVYVPAKTMPEIPMLYSSQQETMRDGPKKGFNVVHKQAEIVTEAPFIAPTPSSVDHQNDIIKVLHTKITTKNPKASKPATPSEVKVTPLPQIREHFSTMDNHDGLSEHPSSAVFLLVLGVAMTCVLGAAVGARGRAARRRARRGGASLAHDADYLVNGMYL